MPDIVVATPGRMIDHLRNSMSVDLDDLAVLILDEADRLLELGFNAEIRELVYSKFQFVLLLHLACMIYNCDYSPWNLFMLFTGSLYSVFPLFFEFADSYKSCV